MAGFFKRLLGGVGRPSDGAVQAEAPYIRPPRRLDLGEAWVSCVGYQAVAGESYRQSELAECATSGRLHAAVLQTEPMNPWDRNAVAVFVGSHMVGYVPATSSPLFAPMVAAIEQEGFAPHCLAKLVGGTPSKPSYGVVLGLAGSDLARMPTVPDCLPLWPDRTVTVTREEHYQGVLRNVLTTHGAMTFADLSMVERDPHMKKDSGPVIALDVCGQRIGYFTANKSAEYAEAADGPACAFVMLAQSSRRVGLVEATALMPRLDDY